MVRRKLHYFVVVTLLFVRGEFKEESAPTNGGGKKCATHLPNDASGRILFFFFFSFGSTYLTITLITGDLLQFVFGIR